MDTGTAKVLFREGATFVLLDMPVGSEFGIDYNSWTTGPKFRGVKMIPPGIHFVYYSARSTSLGGMRTGFFHNFKQREIVIKKWDKYNEDIIHCQVSTEDQQRVESNMLELDEYLGAYPYDSYKKWVSLTSHLTENLLSRLQPECGTITSVKQFESLFSDTKMRREAAEKEENIAEMDPKEKGLPDLTTVAGTEMRFTEIPKQRYPDGASPQEITKHSMDSSYILETLLKSAYSKNNNEILGEVQFAFICFLIGQVFDAFDQWKLLVHLICSSASALNSQSDLFMKFIAMLHFQVHEIPEDFFVDIVSANNFLTSTLQEFFSNLDEGNGDAKLRQRGTKFREHLTKKFNWDFITEPEDFAPVVVDT